MPVALYGADSAESNWGQWRMRLRDPRDAPKVVVDPKGQLSVASHRDAYGDDGGKNAWEGLYGDLIGLIVTGSAALIASRPRGLAACAVGVPAKPLPAAGCN
jgi:hypothetical protein